MLMFTRALFFPEKKTKEIAGDFNNYNEEGFFPPVSFGEKTRIQVKIILETVTARDL